MLTHLLDTSAWIAHLQRESGWEVVSKILADPEISVGISTLSLVELHARMRLTGREADFIAVTEDYRELLESFVPVDEATSLHTIFLRQITGARIPAIDAMIAATASLHGATLVHRDAHFEAVPADLLRQLALPTG
jgi:predicted nucleic acid-binding protein